MVLNAIKVFGRVKPNASNRNTVEYHIYHSDDTDLLMLSRFSNGLQLNRQNTFKFRFEKIFDQCVTQEDIFDVVAKPVVESVLSGYNGTVFAYGQTGSGKTFTMSGGKRSRVERGIIPRSIEHLFGAISQGQIQVSTMCVSYLEIYNEHGYDLLDAKPNYLPQVSLLEDARGKLHIRNLSMHQVYSEDEALKLLFLGDSNRMTVHTAMNPESSRSHCIFTIYVTSHESRAKLNLVDLAGSERVYKCQLGGQMLVEARHINLSLHFLEQVILALGESKRSHIPYRNSLLTSVLRDSVGGSCMTVMVATLCMCVTNIEESVSTCRFAQRVALVTNDMSLSEHLDPQQELVMLRAELQQLRAQLAKYQNVSELTSEDTAECRKVVSMFLKDEEAVDLSHIQGDKKIRLCFSLLKEAASTSQEREESQQLKQRDGHINDLLCALKDKKKKQQQSRNVASVSPHSEDYTKIDMKSFESFMYDPSNRQQVTECEALLRKKYEQAKNVAADIKWSQTSIKSLHNVLKKYSEHYRVISKNDTWILQTEDKIRAEQMYCKKKLEELKVLKSESDHLKCELQAIKINLLLKFKKFCKTQNDFSDSKYEKKISYNNHCYEAGIVSNDEPTGTGSKFKDGNTKFEEEEELSNNITLQEIYSIDRIPNCDTDAVLRYSDFENTKENFDLQNSCLISNVIETEVSDIAAAYARKNSSGDVANTCMKAHDNEEALFIGSVPLTGDAEIDEEIIDFYRARSQVICR